MNEKIEYPEKELNPAPGPVNCWFCGAPDYTGYCAECGIDDFDREISRMPVMPRSGPYFQTIRPLTKVGYLLGLGLGLGLVPALVILQAFIYYDFIGPASAWLA